MAGMWCGAVGESEIAAAPVEASPRSSRRRRMEIRQLKFVADMPEEASRKRQKVEACSRESVENSESKPVDETNQSEKNEIKLTSNPNPRDDESAPEAEEEATQNRLKYGMTSVCGRRRDMEDAVSIHPSFSNQAETNFFGVFDGHGCSHVAMRCRDRLHQIVKRDLDSAGDAVDWKNTLSQSFEKMDKEVHDYISDASTTPNCRCELRTPQCDAVGSTAVVAIVTPDKIIVSNCGDSRAVLSRNGVSVPLSSDHKPDRPDELARIENAGGRVIYWDGARVLGVLAMSRAIGDNYLKPYVISEPEVLVIDRTPDDECLILGSDGLWDVVSNDTACGVARMCLRAGKPPGSPGSHSLTAGGDAAKSSDKACSDATILLTKLALARHSTDNVSVVVVDLRKDDVHSS